jgi:hypothetical protein
VADALQRHQFGPGNPAGQCLGMTEGKHGIRRAVDDQGRRGDLAEPPAR